MDPLGEKNQAHRCKEQTGGCQRLGGGELVGKMGEEGQKVQKVQTSTYNINTSWGGNV